jgi:hypothetical protein
MKNLFYYLILSFLILSSCKDNSVTPSNNNNPPANDSLIIRLDSLSGYNGILNDTSLYSPTAADTSYVRIRVIFNIKGTSNTGFVLNYPFDEFCNKPNPPTLDSTFTNTFNYNFNFTLPFLIHQYCSIDLYIGSFSQNHWIKLKDLRIYKTKSP